MKLTAKLVGFLNRVFLRNPDPFLALRVTYPAGGMTWTIADETLTLTVTGGAGASQTIDLTAYSLVGLATAIAGLTGYEVLYLDPERSGLSARILLDGSGNQALSNGDHFFGYTALPWAYLDAVSSELAAAETQIVAMPAEMSIPTSNGFWLDFLGDYYAVPRFDGEIDALYGPRIIATVLLPRGNNVAIENAIKAFTGQDALVTNVGAVGPSTQYYAGSFNFDGSHFYQASTPAPKYNLFDIVYAYDLVSGGDLTAFASSVTALIEVLRDAGNHMRSLSLVGSTTADAMTRTPTDSFGDLLVSVGFYYDGSANYDGSNTYAGVRTYVE